MWNSLPNPELRDTRSLHLSYKPYETTVFARIFFFFFQFYSRASNFRERFMPSNQNKVIVLRHTQSHTSAKKFQSAMADRCYVAMSYQPCFLVCQGSIFIGCSICFNSHCLLFFFSFPSYVAYLSRLLFCKAFKLILKTNKHFNKFAQPFRYKTGGKRPGIRFARPFPSPLHAACGDVT